VVNEGPVIAYQDPFEMGWTHQGPGVTVEAHGAAVWVDYECEGGYDAPSMSMLASGDVTADEGVCTIPSDEPSDLMMVVTGYNTGDAIARGVTVTLELPEGVTVTHAEPARWVLDGASMAWDLGDLAPGSARRLEVVVSIEPDAGEWADPLEVGTTALQSQSALPEPYVMGQLLAIDHSDGEFTDDYSKRLVTGRVGDAFWVNVRFEPRTVYMPMILRRYDARPDLVVVDVVINPDNASDTFIVLANRGNGTAWDFWVDAYFDPASPPAVNQPWATLNPGYGGAAWVVDRLDAGEAITLTLGDDYSIDDQSRWPPAYTAGEHTVWAYVDSWGDPNPLGGVYETDETNNRFGPLVFTASGMGMQTLELDEASLAPIPPRRSLEKERSR
jgi:hypothetical protein